MSGTVSPDIRGDEPLHAVLAGYCTRGNYKVSGRSAIRIGVVSYLSTEDHLRELQKALVKAAAQLNARRWP